MTSTTNILVQVQEYNKSGLGFLVNQMPIASKMTNARFRNFQDIKGNLGSSTLLELPYRFSSAAGLVAAFQGAVMNQATLTCDQAENVSYGFNAQERLFTVDKNDAESYMDTFGKAALITLANNMEKNLALNFISGVPVNTVVNNETVPTGALHTESGPYRFYNAISNGIQSYQQLDQIMENFIAFGAEQNDMKCVLPNISYPAIIGSGLNQFAQNRNNEIANSWDLGRFGTPGCDFYKSNLLPIHTSGNVGNASGTGNQLTVVSTNDPTGQAISQIVFSGATASDASAIFAGDLAQVVDGVSGKPNVRFMAYIGGANTGLPVQIRVTANAGATGGGQVTVNFTPTLSVNPQPQDANTIGINTNIVAGMKFAFLPSHR